MLRQRYSQQPKGGSGAESVGARMDKHSAVSPYSGVFLSLEKDENSSTCYDMVELRGYDAK